MRLLDVRLQNITCFEDLTIDCRSVDSDQPAPWVVLLGENGTGKSTILQMIGAALLGFNNLSVLAGDIDWRGYVRSGSGSTSSIRVAAEPEPTDSGYEKYITQVPFNSSKPETYDGNEVLDCARPTLLIGNDGKLETRSGVHYDEVVLRSELTTGWFACGYSPWRRLSRRPRGDNGPFPTLADRSRAFRFSTLFGEGSGLTSVSDWIAGLYFRSIHPDHGGLDTGRFETATEALLRAIPGIKSLIVSSDQQVLVTEHERQFPIERLSDGYRGTLAWVGDLIRRLFDAYPDSDNPLHERGVVLVDEIDQHLHPMWQRTVVHDIRTLFPNLQFIVTTHSPFVAQGLLPEDRIIVLERSRRTGAVTARDDSGDLESWSADQILSSYFGLLKGTRGANTMRRESRYERLLDAEANGTLTDKQKKELPKLEVTLDRVPIGDTASEEALFRTAEALAASLRRRREEIEAQAAESESFDGPADREQGVRAG